MIDHPRRFRILLVGLVVALLVATGCSGNAPPPKADAGDADPDAPADPGTVPAVPQVDIPGPPRPPIIITPGDDGRWVIDTVNAVADGTLTGDKLNECAFGEKSSFFAVVETPDDPTLQVPLVAAVARFGAKTLDVTVGADGKFIWRLDNTPLVPQSVAAKHRWRSDLMTRPSWIQIAPYDELQQPYTVKGFSTKAAGTCLDQ